MVASAHRCAGAWAHRRGLPSRRCCRNGAARDIQSRGVSRDRFCGSGSGPVGHPLLFEADGLNAALSLAAIPAPAGTFPKPCTSQVWMRFFDFIFRLPGGAPTDSQFLRPWPGTLWAKDVMPNVTGVVRRNISDWRIYRSSA